MADIDKWNNEQWQALLMRLTLDDLMLLLDETKKTNASTRAIKVLEKLKEYQLAKSIEETVGVILTQSRAKMVEAYSAKWTENAKFREDVITVKGIKMGLGIAITSSSSAAAAASGEAVMLERITDNLASL